MLPIHLSQILNVQIGTKRLILPNLTLPLLLSDNLVWFLYIPCLKHLSPQAINKPQTTKLFHQIIEELLKVLLAQTIRPNLILNNNTILNIQRKLPTIRLNPRSNTERMSSLKIIIFLVKLGPPFFRIVSRSKVPVT